MNLFEKLLEQGSNPSGSIGTVVGKIMNRVHASTHDWALNKCPIEQNWKCLDIGCGGGSVVKKLARLIEPPGKVYGIDHSEKMVRLSTSINNRGIQLGKVVVLRCSVSNLPYSTEQFNLVTAFETIQFWPNLFSSVKNIHSIMKPGGVFIILNQFPNKNTEWYNKMQIKTEKEYTELLNKAGFSSILIDTSKKNWILVTARKEREG